MGLADDARRQQAERAHQDAEETLQRSWAVQPLISSQVVELAQLCLDAGQKAVPLFQRLDKRGFGPVTYYSRISVEGWVAQHPQGYCAFSHDGRMWDGANLTLRHFSGDFATSGLPRGRSWVVRTPRVNGQGDGIPFDAVEAAGEVIRGRMLNGLIPMNEHTARRVAEARERNR
jgi:hypothetical protein